MYQLHTEKQQKYFKEVIRLHYEEGYGENWIARIIPIGQTTSARWIAIFAREKGKIKGMANMAKSQETASVQTDSTHGLPTYPDLVKDFIPTAPNQLWVSDITYIVIVDDESHYHFCYLSMVLVCLRFPLLSILFWLSETSLKTR